LTIRKKSDAVADIVKTQIQWFCVATGNHRQLYAELVSVIKK